MKDIKHWETRTMKWQERHQKYTSDSKYDIVTLEHEALVIFCIETGEHKIIKHKEDIEITGETA